MEVVKISERSMQSNTIKGYGKLIIDKGMLYQTESNINAGNVNEYNVYLDCYDEYIRRFTDIDISVEEMQDLIDACVFNIWLQFNEQDNCILRISIDTDEENLSFVDESKLNIALDIIKKYNIKNQVLGFYCKHIDTVGNYPIYDIDILYNNIYE